MVAGHAARCEHGHEGQAGGATQSTMERSLERWLDAAPRLECDWEPLEATYRRSLVDLAALRFSPLTSPGARACPPRGCPGS